MVGSHCRRIFFNFRFTKDTPFASSHQNHFHRLGERSVSVPAPGCPVTVLFTHIPVPGTGIQLALASVRAINAVSSIFPSCSPGQSRDSISPFTQPGPLRQFSHSCSRSRSNRSSKVTLHSLHVVKHTDFQSVFRRRLDLQEHSQHLPPTSSSCIRGR